MPRSTFGQLPSSIAGLVVDPEAEVAWFGPLPGLTDLVDRSLRRAPRRAEVIDEVEKLDGRPGRVLAKASAKAWAILHSLAALGIVAPSKATQAYGRALGLHADIDRLDGQRKSGASHFADTWLMGNEGDFTRAEMVALRLIAAVRRDGGAERHTRRVAYALADWQSAHGPAASRLVDNALAVVAGVLGPDGTPSALALQHILGRDPNPMRDHAGVDARARVVSGNDAPMSAHLALRGEYDPNDKKRVLGRVRGNAGYSEMVAKDERALRTRTKTELAAVTGMTEAEAARKVTVVELPDGTREDLGMTLGDIEAAFRPRWT